MRIEIDTEHEIIKVADVAYSFGFFRALSRYGLTEGEHFFIQRREEIGDVTKLTIARVLPEEEPSGEASAE